LVSRSSVRIDVIADVVVASTVDAVAAYAANPDNAPQWQENVESVEWITDRPLQVGSRLAFVAWFRKQKLSFTYEVTAWEPGRLLVMRTMDGPYRLETTYRWTLVREGYTRMTLRNRGEVPGVPRLLGPFLSWAMRRMIGDDLHRLRERLETAG
jgi:uncharacterized membrane protein